MLCALILCFRTSSMYNFEANVTQLVTYVWLLKIQLSGNVCVLCIVP